MKSYILSISYILGGGSASEGGEQKMSGGSKQNSSELGILLSPVTRICAKAWFAFAACIIFGPALTSCSDDDTVISDELLEDDYTYVGTAIGNFSEEEWYPGGLLGTTENKGSTCYEDPAPAVEEQGLLDEFNHGEYFFEGTYTLNTTPFNGLGPAAVRSSCLDCHPGYGHGKRQTSYTATWGNGYLLVIYHPSDGANSNDGSYIDEVTAMPQTIAASPFLPPIDESGITISWNTVTEMESGLPMYFPDGTTYELIYPEVYIESSAFNTDPVPTNLAFRLESTIGVIGVGMIDAIPEDSIKAQYQKEVATYKAAGLDPTEYVNSNYWDVDADDWGSSAWYTLAEGYLADGTYYDSMKKIKRYTYAMTRASLQDGPGANAIWNITNVSRSDRHYLYTTSAWAKAMSENDDVISAILADTSSPYYEAGGGTKDGISEALLTLLDPSTDQFDNNYYCFSPEMTDDNYYDFLVWHRGLAIPRARNLHKEEVQRGKEIFYEIGCTNCHRPKWTTTDDNYWTPAITENKPLPRFQNQNIYPYTDLIHHKLYMKNDIHGSWCRTTPLWGRGLSLSNTGAQDRLHDCRARNEIEAVMWHAYSQDSHAYSAALQFYNLSTEDREAVVAFLKAI